MKKNLSLLLSCFSFIYFVGLIFISIKNILLNDIFEALFETATIPLIVLVAILIVISFKAWHADKWEVKSKSFPTVLILTATVALIIFATVFNV
ncbi:hypothetical protein [Daejeonella sp.]|uniref:hypothetical protein n=1 Tax=Daejeonella sp. TaxID=2805397 RepID=UPI0025C1DE8D|nr:hypothetical protein [Daejeonella sp.]